MKNLKFSVIIANFNGEMYLPDCLSSVFKTTYPNFETILVEDGSTDRSLEIIERFRKKEKIEMISNVKNLGLVKSRNKAIKIAKGEILVFLDNDTKVDKNWLVGLNRVFQSDQSIGAAQCKIFDFNKKNLIQQIGMKIVPYTGFGFPVGRGQKDIGQFENREEIIALGAALAVRKNVAVKIRGFDEGLFHYTDDLDFSWRVWIAGYRIVLSPQSKVFHHIKIHTPNYKLYYHLSKNSFRMLIKNYQLRNLIIFLPCSLIFNFAGVVYVLLRRGSLGAIYGFLLGIIWSLRFFPDTLRKRNEINNFRKFNDEIFFKKIMIPFNVFRFYSFYFKTAKTTDYLIDTTR